MEIMSKIFGDRPREQVLSAAAATWLLFCLAFVAEDERPSISDVLTGGILGAVLVVVGFAATWRLRPLPIRRVGERGKLAACRSARGASSEP